MSEPADTLRVFVTEVSRQESFVVFFFIAHSNVVREDVAHTGNGKLLKSQAFSNPEARN